MTRKPSALLREARAKPKRPAKRPAPTPVPLDEPARYYALREIRYQALLASIDCEFVDGNWKSFHVIGIKRGRTGRRSLSRGRGVHGGIRLFPEVVFAIFAQIAARHGPFDRQTRAELVGEQAVVSLWTELGLAVHIREQFDRRAA